MAKPSVVVVGASAGGVEAFEELIRQLPEGFPAAVFLLLHSNANTPNTLPDLLQARSALTVEGAEDRKEILPGHVYVAVPDHHLRVESGVMRVARGPKENRHRPSIDVLFRSAAAAYGSQVVGVVLTGLLDDGAAGLMMIHRAGGTTIVQDPDDAAFSSMPQSALQMVDPDFTVPLARIPDILVKLAAGEKPARIPISRTEKITTMPIRDETEKKPGTPSVYTCPECSGTLWEVKNGNLDHYECRVGHAYSLGSLVEAKGEALEQALWVALRTLEERASLERRMAQRARERKHTGVAQRWEDQAHSKDEYVGLLREVLLHPTEPAVNE